MAKTYSNEHPKYAKKDKSKKVASLIEPKFLREFKGETIDPPFKLDLFKKFKKDFIKKLFG